MRISRRNPEHLGKFAAAALALGLFFFAKTVSAETVNFHLRTGERIVGTIVSENSDRVVVSNLWASELSIPLTQIGKRETNDVVFPVKSSVVDTNAAAKTAFTNAVVASSAISKTNSPTVAQKASRQKLWRAQVDIGMDLLYGAKDRQIYSGRLKLVYARPYSGNPAKFFRNTLDYLVEYAETDGVISGNRMEGSDKTDFDVGKKTYLYNAFGAGYDKIRKIDLHYETGPGAGYHLLTLTNFAMNTECGVNYQVQDRTQGKDTENFYYRLAEDFTWRIRPTKVTLTQKLEFFPQVEALNEYRARFESKLSFPLLQNLSFNFSVIDLYDTQPASNVSKNELQVRSAIGVTF